MFETLFAKIGYVKISDEVKNATKKQKKKWSQAAKTRARNRKYYRDNRLDIIRSDHRKNPPLLHNDDCPACNRASPLTFDEYKRKNLLLCQKMAIDAKKVKKANKTMKKILNDNAIQVVEQGFEPKTSVAKRYEKPKHPVVQRDQRTDEGLSGGFVQDYVG